MPFGFSSASCLKSSVKRELPPSMTRSPSLSFSERSLTTASVISPAGTMTQTTRGAGRAAIISSSEAASETSGFRS
jgi:hypothetical protein